MSKMAKKVPTIILQSPADTLPICVALKCMFAFFHINGGT